MMSARTPATRIRPALAAGILPQRRLPAMVLKPFDKEKPR